VVRPMAYLKGSLAINPWRDIPLLRQTLHSTVISHSQLFQFMRLGHYEIRRDVFNWRLRRLVEHRMVKRHLITSVSANHLYTITNQGVVCLERHGDCYLAVSPFVQNEGKIECLHLLHYLELNEIHLALLRSQLLSNWIPESRLRNLIAQGVSPYVKAYDAIVEFNLEGLGLRIALEYERTLKNAREYLEIRELIEKERNVSLVLYLLPSSSLLVNVSQHFRGCASQVFFGLLDEFKQALLETSVSENGGIRRRSLHQALMQTQSSFPGLQVALTPS
jgi:hypothetical protein